jgi:hypothetical protein
VVCRLDEVGVDPEESEFRAKVRIRENRYPHRMLQIVSSASLPGSPSVPNEDWFAAGKDYVVVLDGVTPVPDDGCIHGAAWYADTLGNALVHSLNAGTPGLDMAVADAIRDVTEAHQGTCDVTNPMTPGAQVAIVRERESTVDYLVLGDATIVCQHPYEGVQVICDDRVDRLPNPPAPVTIRGVRRYPSEYVASVRNQQGGFWVAAADQQAANEALAGSFDTVAGSRMGLFSDGLTRLVERYDWSWGELLNVGGRDGVPALITAVHRADAERPASGTRGKASDDATGVLLVCN